jgi:metallo-beta-lactamase class B
MEDKMLTNRFTAILIATLLCGGASSLYAQTEAKKPVPKPVTPEIRRHIEASVRLAQGLPNTNSYLPEIYGPSRSGMMIPEESKALIPKPTANRNLLPATKLFDQLYYFGNGYVGAVVLVTSAGIIQWDSMDNAKEAETIIEAGYKSAGLDPSQIKYIVLTHGHSDHFGGAAYFKKKYPGLHVLASEADWKFMDYQVKAGKLQPDRDPPPPKDQVVKDGMKLTLGDTTVALYVTPGHTPGSVSSIIKVTDHGAPHVVAMFGGMTFPLHLAPRENVDGGLDAQISSWKRFCGIAKTAGADAVSSTHPGFDGMRDLVPKFAARKQGEPNPMVMGKDGYDRFCQANLEAGEAIRGEVVLTGGN